MLWTIQLNKIPITQYCYLSKTFCTTKLQVFTFLKKKKKLFILEHFKHGKNVERLVCFIPMYWDFFFSSKQQQGTTGIRFIL